MTHDHSQSNSRINSTLYLRQVAAFDAPTQGAQDEALLLDEKLHEHWNLGENVILVWTPSVHGIDILVVPHYEIPGLASTTHDYGSAYLRQFTDPGLFDVRTQSFLEAVIAGPKMVSTTRFKQIANQLNYPPVAVTLPFTVGEQLPLSVVDTVLRRFSLSHMEDRAVALFDIVGFSLFTPLEQVTQLNSLAFSVNSAHSKMLATGAAINFARTTTGDGFYIWNRDNSIQANVNLYHFMHLVMADNAIARSKAKGNSTPMLRSCFHVGGHYEYYQSEGLSPTVYSYIVGDVTIELARMIEKSLPGQIVVGNFWAPMVGTNNQVQRINTIEFIEQTQQSLDGFKGLVLSGDKIASIKCYLTGTRTNDGLFTIKPYLITDKHGITRTVYNAKVNIYRNQAAPIYLGVQDQEISERMVATS